MSAHRTRGILRAAALLAVGASPLLAGTASAAEAPLDHVDGKLGAAPTADADRTKAATDLLSGQALKLPAPVKAPAAQLPQLPKLPGTPNVPGTSGALGTVDAVTALTAPQERALPGVQVPLVPQVPGAPEVKPPAVQQPVLPGVPEAPKPPVELPHLG